MTTIDIADAFPNLKYLNAFSIIYIITVLVSLDGAPPVIIKKCSNACIEPAMESINTKAKVGFNSGIVMC